jgi:hypothetical protein
MGDEYWGEQSESRNFIERKRLLAKGGVEPIHHEQLSKFNPSTRSGLFSFEFFRPGISSRVIKKFNPFIRLRSLSFTRQVRRGK